MMGAVLMTVNVRLSPEQISYTINHSGAQVLLVNDEFLPLLEEIRRKLVTLRQYVLLSDARAQKAPAEFAGEYEDLLSAASPEFAFPDFDERTRATTFYNHGNDGACPRSVLQSPAAGATHSVPRCGALWPCRAGTDAPRRRVHADHALVPRTCVGPSLCRDDDGDEAGLPGTVYPRRPARMIQQENVTFSHCVPTILHMQCSHHHPRSTEKSISVDMTIMIGGSALSQALAAGRARARDRCGTRATACRRLVRCCRSHRSRAACRAPSRET